MLITGFALLIWREENANMTPYIAPSGAKRRLLLAVLFHKNLSVSRVQLLHQVACWRWICQVILILYDVTEKSESRINKCHAGTTPPPHTSRDDNTSWRRTAETDDGRPESCCRSIHASDASRMSKWWPDTPSSSSRRIQPVSETSNGKHSEEWKVINGCWTWQRPSTSHRRCLVPNWFPASAHRTFARSLWRWRSVQSNESLRA